jgi:hypothetical protein
MLYSKLKIILIMKDNNNNKNITPLSPVHSYVNADLQKSVIAILITIL